MSRKEPPNMKTSLKNKSLNLVILSFILILGFAIPSFPKPSQNTLFQLSTFSAFVNGLYDGSMPAKEFKNYGTLGVGTFSGIDGELIQIGKHIYQVKSDGSVNKNISPLLISFGVTTYFKADQTLHLDQFNNLNELTAYIDSQLKTLNYPYAIKITGNFKTMKTRSIAKQTKPYLSFLDVVKTQTIFEFQNISGTMIGFRLPSYFEGINLPGYHFHFLSSDQTKGGHLLECSGENLKIEIDTLYKLSLRLPKDNPDFEKSNLQPKLSDDIKKTEQNTKK